MRGHHSYVENLVMSDTPNGGEFPRQRSYFHLMKPAARQETRRCICRDKFSFASINIMTHATACRRAP
jgi:hypothetical protein